MNDEIIKNIEDLFTSSIYPTCPKKSLCNNTNLDGFSKKPKMPYIGSEYGNNSNVPNLLFVSLDSGNEYENLHTLTEIREEVENNPPRRKGQHKGKHWFQTFDIAHSFIKLFLEDIEDKDIHYTDQFIAHTNSSKCTQSKEGRAEADKKLFDHCRDFVKKEIQLFNANIIITQGAKAEQVLNSFEVIEKKVFETIHKSKPILFPVFIKSINNRSVLHIPMCHQSCYKEYWGQKQALVENLEQIKIILNQVM